MKRSDITDEEVLEMMPKAYISTPLLQLLVAKGYPEKVVEAKIYHMVDRGLIDYGVGINHVWRTEQLS
jgi:hypothetical protein